MNDSLIQIIQFCFIDFWIIIYIPKILYFSSYLRYIGNVISLQRISFDDTYG